MRFLPLAGLTKVPLTAHPCVKSLKRREHARETLPATSMKRSLASAGPFRTQAA